MKIDKEKARNIYNLYSQIETTEKIIKELQEFIQKYNDGNPPQDIIPANYNPYGSIEISIPYFEGGKFADKGARVFNISYPAAIKVLKSHLRCIKKQLKMEIAECDDLKQNNN